MVINHDEKSIRYKIMSVKIEIIKGCIIAFVLAVTFSSTMDILYQNNIQAQVTMYKCSPDMGINVSMVNCLTNDTADTYYTSMVTEMRQNQTEKVAQDTLNGTNQTATQGLESAMNETGEALSNVTGDVVEGFNELINGSSQ